MIIAILKTDCYDDYVWLQWGVEKTECGGLRQFTLYWG